MAVTKPALKRASLALSIILLVFGLVELGLTIAVSTYQLHDPSTGIYLTASLAVLAIPTAWAGICAAVSRHRTVYVIFSILSTLATLEFLGMLGMAVFSASFLDNTNGSSVRGLTVGLIAIHVIVTLLLIGSCIVANIASCSKNRSNGGLRAAPGFVYMDHNQSVPPAQISTSNAYRENRMPSNKPRGDNYRRDKMRSYPYPAHMDAMPPQGHGYRYYY